MPVKTGKEFTIGTAQRLADCLARIQSRWDGVEYTMTVTQIEPEKERQIVSVPKESA